MFFIIINPFSKQAATTEKEKKSDAQIVFTTDRKRNWSGFFFRSKQGVFMKQTTGHLRTLLKGLVRIS